VSERRRRAGISAAKNLLLRKGDPQRRKRGGLKAPREGLGSHIAQGRRTALRVAERKTIPEEMPDPKGGG